MLASCVKQQLDELGKHTMMKRNFLWVSVSVIVGQLLLSNYAYATSEENDGRTVYTLEEIVVEGKTEGIEAAGTVHTLTAEDISVSGARNLSEAIELLPGIDIFTGGKGVPRVNLRGFRTRHVRLLLDGIPLNSAYDQQFDPSIIPVEHIEKITVHVGPSSVLYGQGDTGGVINIITKKGSKQLNGMVGAEVGEGGASLRKASLSFGGKSYDFFLSGSDYLRDAYLLSKDFVPTSEEDGGDRENSDKETKNIFSKVAYDVNEEFNLSLTLNHVSGEYGIPGSVIDDSSDFFAPNPKYARIDDFEGLSLQLAGEYSPSDTFSLRSWAFINRMNQEYNEFETAEFDTWIYKYDQHAETRGIFLQPTLDMGKIGRITLGFSAEKSQWESHGKIKDHLVLVSVFPMVWEWAIGYPYNKKEVDLYSLTMEYEFMATPKLGFVLGSGYHSQSRDELEDDDHSLLLASHYDMSDRLRLNAAYQRSIRFPSLRQLYDDRGGNPELETERVNHYTTGMELKLPRKTLITLDGFKSIARNFIEKNKQGVNYPFENFDKYEFKGAEIALESRAIQNLMLRASYSLLRTKDLSGTGRDQLHNRPEKRITFSGKYDFPFGLSFYSSILHVADQYYYTRNPPYIKAKLESHTLCNMKLNQRLFNDRINLYVGVNNVFDENYERSYGLPQAGRFVYGGVEIKF